MAKRLRPYLARPTGHAVSGASDRTLRLWNLETGSEVSRFTGDAAFTACAIGQDGCLVVAGDAHGHICFFTLRP